MVAKSTPNSRLPATEIARLNALRRANLRRRLIARWRGEEPGRRKYFTWDRRQRRLVPHRCSECGR